MEFMAFGAFHPERPVFELFAVENDLLTAHWAPGTVDHLLDELITIDHITSSTGLGLYLFIGPSPIILLLFWLI